MNTKPKILIVDDKPENLVALRTVLKDLDIETVEAASGNDALRATLHHDFTLALLDVQMPDMDGYELATILRGEEKTMHLPFIFISAVYTDNLDVFKGYEKGAFSFLTKPFEPQILINKVQFFIDKHQQEIALSELNRELEAFTYSVSHDLRAPLRAVNGYSEMLNEDYGDKLDDEAKRIIENIRHYTRKMGILIDDLLTFSRLGRKELQMRDIDMNELAGSVIAEIKKQGIGNTEITTGRLHPVKADYSLIYQVMLNLISNAVKYSSKKPEPRVEISSVESKGEIIFSIKDNGAGFDMNYADKLFGVFQRLHSQEEFEGTGVGLAMVQRIISRHKGRIWAEGKVNEGATFFFTLKNQPPKI